MVEALWSVQFGTPDHHFGAGVIVLETGRVLGGDSRYTYVGSYNVNEGVLTATIHCRKYSDLVTHESVFGDINEFDMVLTGDAHTQRMVLEGHLGNSPSQAMVLEAVRRAELPQ